MGMNGAHLEQGFTTPDPEEAAVKRLAMKNSEETFVLIDHTKFNQLSFTSVAPLEAATIITERCPLEFVNDSVKRQQLRRQYNDLYSNINPSIDYIVRVDGLKLGDLNRMKEDFKLPGGKGINVSRILKRIDSQSTALGFLGGFTGEFISKWLEKEQIQSLFTTVKEDTRINIKLKSDTETEINGLGPSISDEEIDELKQALGTVGQGDIVVLSGSTRQLACEKDFIKN